MDPGRDSPAHGHFDVACQVDERFQDALAIHAHGRALSIIEWSSRSNQMKASILSAFILALSLTGCDRLNSGDIQRSAAVTGGGDARSGRVEIRKYGCNTCHEISGVPGARGLVGPPLDHFVERSYIAGEIPNTPDNLMLWIQHPRQIEPHTVMPEMGVTEKDSRDIAAYLYTLR